MIQVIVFKILTNEYNDSDYDKLTEEFVYNNEFMNLTYFDKSCSDITLVDPVTNKKYEMKYNDRKILILMSGVWIRYTNKCSSRVSKI